MPYPHNIEKLTRWRLIFGGDAIQELGDDDLLSPDEQRIDKVLEKIYGSHPHAQLQNSTPQINTWLGDIRNYFPTSVVQMLHKEAIERLNLTKLLLKPELLAQLEPNVHLVATILTLQQSMPEETKVSARQVIQKIVDQLDDKLSFPLLKSLQGAIAHSIPTSRPRKAEIDWKKTIIKNLKYYQPEYKTIIPSRLFAHHRRSRSIPEIVLCVDQSASMASSVVYSSIYACVLAQIDSLKTSLIMFDSVPYDFSDQLHDPVEILFGLNLGGGTDINRAVELASLKVHNPTETIFFLISDLKEGGNTTEMITRMRRLKDSGAIVIALLTLSDDGIPRYDKRNAQQLAAYDIPTTACTPDAFPDLIEQVISEQLHQ